MINEENVTDWFGLYGGGWGDEIYPTSFSHPAKYSRGLIRHIYEYAIERGYLKQGDTIIDPFGGVGLGGKDAATHGLIFTGVELELHFNNLALQNIIQWAEKEWCSCGDENQTYLCLLREIIRERGVGGEPKEESKIGAVLQSDVQQQLSLFGQEAHPRNQSEDFREGETPNDGEKLQLEGRAHDSCSRVHNDTGERPSQDGTRSHHGATRGAQNDEAGGSPPYQRQQTRQPLGKSTSDDPIGTHAAAPPGRNKGESKTENLRDLREGVHGEAQSGLVRRAMQARERAAVRAATQREKEGRYCRACLKPIVPYPIVLEGDSRKLADVVRGWAEGAISSPPYSGRAQEGNTKERDERRLRAIGREDLIERLKTEFRDGRYYGGDPAQLGNMPEGEFSAAISSPPFGAGETRDRHSVQAGEVAGAMTRAYTQDRQGQHEGNLARLDDGKGFTAAMKSPPYADSLNSEKNGIDWSKAKLDYPGRKIHGERVAMHQRHHNERRYGASDGQLGAMKEGQFDSAISSPPYSDSLHTNESREADLERMTGKGLLGAARKSGRNSKNGNQGYGVTPGQLASLKDGQFDSAVSSPPYADAVGKGDGPGARHDPVFHNGDNAYKVSNAAEYGRTPGNLGNLDGGSFSAAVSSPPWENTLSRDVVDAASRRQWARENGISNAEFVSPVDMERIGCRDQEYGRSNGNVGNEQGETFWLAAKTIVEQVYEVLKPGGVAIWVTKRFVRDGSIVDFSDQWEQLCASVGFVPLERIRARLIEDKGTQLGVFGEHKDKSIKRSSFFRKLYEKKYPHNSIDWEDVIVMKKI